MKTYKEIAQIAEERVDTLASLTHAEAMNCDICSAMEVLLNCVGIENYASPVDREVEGITPQYRLSVAKKVMAYSGDLMEYALSTVNEHHVNQGRFVYSLYRQMDMWLKWHDEQGNPVGFSEEDTVYDLTSGEMESFAETVPQEEIDATAKKILFAVENDKDGRIVITPGSRGKIILYDSEWVEQFIQIVRDCSRGAKDKYSVCQLEAVSSGFAEDRLSKPDMLQMR